MKHIIDSFTPSGGNHCVSNSLKQVFDYYGYSLSEQMLFGIASGLSFVYINLANSPMISGRTKVFEFEEKLAKRLNVNIKCKQYKEYDTAFSKTIELLDNNTPVLVYVDMPYLNYLSLNKNSHFGGHAIVIFGYDKEKEVFYVSDRDNHDYPIRTPGGNIAKDYHLVSFEEMKQARSSKYRPFPFNNKFLEFNFGTHLEVNTDIIKSAINDTCKSMLNPGANLMGINGIKKFKNEIVKWDKFDTRKLKLAGTTNYFLISKDGGTGGGIFRKMYGEFLLEANNLLCIKDIEDIGKQYIKLSEQWDALADTLWNLGETGHVNLLKPMSFQIEILYQIEKSLLERLYYCVEQ
jgi:hypothetical protein